MLIKPFFSWRKSFFYMAEASVPSSPLTPDDLHCDEKMPTTEAMKINVPYPYKKTYCGSELVYEPEEEPIGAPSCYQLTFGPAARTGSRMTPTLEEGEISTSTSSKENLKEAVEKTKVDEPTTAGKENVNPNNGDGTVFRFLTPEAREARDLQTIENDIWVGRQGRPPKRLRLRASESPKIIYVADDFAAMPPLPSPSKESPRDAVFRASV